MTSVVYSTIVTPINNTAPLVVGSTLSMSEAMSFPLKINSFSFSMSLMGMLNTLTGSQSTSQVSNIGVRELFNFLPSDPLGWRSYYSIVPIRWEWGFPIFHGLTPSGAGVLPWVFLACHPLPLHSHYMVDSGSNPFTTSTVSARGNPFQA
jgi:hypothetical protein